MTRRIGELTEWNDERGFGFIAVDGETERLFVHVKAIRSSHARPQAGDRLSFETGIGREGRPAAVDVAIAGAVPRARVPTGKGRPERRSGLNTSRPLGALVLLLMLMGAIALGRVPPEFALIYLVMGGASAWSYAADKRAAENRRWRTSEGLLHGLDLFGGIIGGLVAQHIWRHKTVKPGFAVTTWLIAGLHVVLLAATIGGLTQGFVEEQLRALGVGPLTQGELR